MPPKHTQLPKRSASFAALALTLALATTAFLNACGNAPPPGEHARTDLPAFDTAKAQQLSPKTRAALEQELFSELSLWNRSSVKYPTKADIDLREQRWLEMANQGFELAYITLQVLEPSKGRIHELQRPMKRLEQLAESGDVGAMCLITDLVSNAYARLKTNAYDKLYKKWLGHGAEIGHPQCQIILGARLLAGTEGYTKDVPKGLAMSFAAHKAGYVHDVGPLILHYESKGYNNFENVQRMYCWMHVSYQTRLGDPMRYLRQGVKEESPSLINQLKPKLDELQDWKPELQNCIDLGSGEAP